MSSESATSQTRAVPGRLGTTELGCFRLKRVLGRGSRGTAYVAEHLGSDREAVVKIADTDLMDGMESDAVRREFAYELYSAKRVQHENLAAVFKGGATTDGAPAIAMEFVRGDSLDDLLGARAGNISPDLLGEWFCQLGGAVASLHAVGAAHRNLSPRNIVVGVDSVGASRATILDFGVAELAGRAAGRARGQVVPRYMPPEQILGAARAPADVFALGAILWWALTGEEFSSEVRSVQDLAHARVDGQSPPDPRHVLPAIPVAVAELVSSMLSLEEAARPSAAEFVTRWDAAAKAFPKAAPKVPMAPVVAPPPPSSVRTTASMLHKAQPTPARARPTSPRRRLVGSEVARVVIDPVTRERLGAAPASAVRGEIEKFVGDVPELLAQISDCLEAGTFTGARRACRALQEHAGGLGAGHLARLSHVCAELIREGELERLTGFTTDINIAEVDALCGLATEMEREYGEAFLELMKIHAGAEAKDGR